MAEPVGTSLSATAAEWLLSLHYDRIPDDVARAARLRLLDTIGVAIATSTLPIGRAMREGALALGPGTGSHILGFGDAASPMLAALANGAMAEGTLFDDTHGESETHVSAPLLATIFALGEVTGASGSEAFATYVGASEIACRLGIVAPGRLHEHGFHTTGIVGALSSAYAAGKLLELDARTLVNAVGIAGSFASGINASWADGSWTQLMHPGWASHGGIVAAHLARSGYTGPSQVLEGRFGVYRTHIQDPQTPFDFERMSTEFGSRWECRNISLKPYPNAAVIHPFLDALLALRAEHNVRGEDVERIVCPMASYVVPLVCAPEEERWEPVTQVQARTSLQFSLAEAIYTGSLGFSAFSDETLRNPAIRSLSRRVSYEVDPDAPSSKRFKGHVIVYLKDGTKLERIQDFHRGSLENPMTEDEVVEKFRHNTALRLTDAKIEGIQAAVARIEELPDLHELVRLCIV